MKIPGWICHQKSERSFYLFNKKLPLCSRCIALYMGIMGGFFLNLIFRISFRFNSEQLLLIMVMMILPMAIDGITQLFKLRESNNSLRALTGILAGIITGILIYHEFFK